MTPGEQSLCARGGTVHNIVDETQKQQLTQNKPPFQAQHKKIR